MLAGFYIGSMTIEETTDRHDSVSKVFDKPQKETGKGSKLDDARLEMKCECDLSVYVLLCTSMY